MAGYLHPWLSGLHRRRQAAARSVPLDCGCADCWPCYCGEKPPSRCCGDEPPADRWVDAGRAAARHLIDAGYTPILQQQVLCALWRRGGGDRALAQNLYDLASW
jgi:hypothetical protein